MVAEKVSAAELARRKGVTRAAVTTAFNNGRLHRDRDGKYDLSHPDNASYLHNVRQQQRAKQKPKPNASPPAVVVSGGNGAHAPNQSVTERKSVTISQERTVSSGDAPRIDGLTLSEWELRKTVAQALQIEQKTAIERGDFVPKSDVRIVFAQLDNILSGQIGTLDQRVASKIVAACGLPPDQEPVIAALVKEPSLGAIGQVKRLLAEYVKGLEVEG